MQVYLNRIDGWDDAILSMFYSKRHVDREFEMMVRRTVFNAVINYPDGQRPVGALVQHRIRDTDLSDWLYSLFKWAPHHITMGRFLDFSFTVYDLHRAGQDDLDSHAKRMENRIIRSSTRLADFQEGEMSNYYREKIIPTDVALAILGITAPDELEFEGKTYVKAVNGYILKGMENDRDVKRGLYMLSIPSSFIFKINMTEFAHLYKERRIEGGANPEVKQAVEMMVDQLVESTINFVNRGFLMSVKN